jgi:hypothetical protein
MSIFGRLRKGASDVERNRFGTDLSTEAPSARAAVPTSWLAVPTLAESNTERRLAGTSFHQQLLADTAQRLRAASPVVDVVTVQLAVLEHGEYVGAVGVYLAGRRAGSIPVEQVEAYRPVVADLTAQGRPATCRASVVGGGTMRDGDGVLNFGLGLLQPNRPAAAAPDAPFLPPHVGMRVSVSAGAATELDADIPSRAKRFVHRRVGALTRDGALSIGGVVVGRLEDAGGVHEVLQAAQSAGHPLSCAVRLIREPERPLRVAVDLPMSGAL